MLSEREEDVGEDDLSPAKERAIEREDNKAAAVDKRKLGKDEPPYFKGVPRTGASLMSTFAGKNPGRTTAQDSLQALRDSAWQHAKAIDRVAQAWRAWIAAAYGV